MISVIIPLYNARSTVIGALDSVRQQTVGLQRFQVIVINDGSTDGGDKLIEDYILANPNMQISLLNQNNQGVSSARNAGMKIAKGEYIAFLDADDIWHPEKTEKQIRYLEDIDKSIDFIACRKNKSRLLFPYQVKNGLSRVTFRRLLFRNETQPSTVIFKRKIIENTGYFDEKQKYAEDHNFWLKISFQNAMFILDENLIVAGNGKKTFGVSGLSANLSEMERGFIKNLWEMYSLKKLTIPEYILYRAFYKSKYLFLLLRKFFNI